MKRIIVETEDSLHHTVKLKVLNDPFLLSIKDYVLGLIKKDLAKKPKGE